MNVCGSANAQDENRFTRQSRTHPPENRLIAAERGTSNATVSIVHSYDPDGACGAGHQGRRTTKTQISGLSTQVSSFVWGLDLSGSMQAYSPASEGIGGAGGILLRPAGYGGQVGGLLATKLDGQTYFSCFDANPDGAYGAGGNVTDLVDNNGDSVAHYEYGPFPVRSQSYGGQVGGTIAATGDKKDDFRSCFSTKYLDDELGWYYYGYRSYNPSLGRWVSRDPIREEGGVDLLVFAMNSAINGFDLLGLLCGAERALYYASLDGLANTDSLLQDTLYESDVNAGLLRRLSDEQQAARSALEDFLWRYRNGHLYDWREEQIQTRLRELRLPVSNLMRRTSALRRIGRDLARLSDQLSFRRDLWRNSVHASRLAYHECMGQERLREVQACASARAEGIACVADCIGELVVGSASGQLRDRALMAVATRVARAAARRYALRGIAVVGAVSTVHDVGRALLCTVTCLAAEEPGEVSP